MVKLPPPGAGTQPGTLLPGVMPPTRTSVGDIIATALSVFGRGMKVACEIAIMAADAGLVMTDTDVIAIAGTHAGADMAILLQPAISNRFYELRVREIICKPHL